MSTAARSRRESGASGDQTCASRSRPSRPTVSAYCARASCPFGSRYSSMRRPYRSNQSPGTQARNQSGAAAAMLLSACRNVSATHSKRLRSRRAPSTWVESVRCRPRAFRYPRSLHAVRNASSRRSSPEPWMRRARNSQSTEKWKPGSVNSRPRAYIQSMRARTASAAWRSESPSANCMTVTSARRQGASAGRPRVANSGVKLSSS